VQLLSTMRTFLVTSFLCASHAFAPNSNDAISIHGLGVILRDKNSALVRPQRILHRNPVIFRNSVRTASTSLNLAPSDGIELGYVVYDCVEKAASAWDWTANLGAPAALVAGAVLATLLETRETMTPRNNDAKWIRMLKKSCRFLLLSSFFLEVVCIFVGTVTGSVLLGHGSAKGPKVGYTSPLALLHHHHEFEYLTVQISFLQGVLNWLIAVTMDFLIPKENESKDARKMNQCLGSILVSLTLWIIAFYNNHLNFYSDYSTMLRRYFVLFIKRYVWCWPIRPMSLLYIPSFIVSLVLTWRAFTSSPEKPTKA